MAGLLRFDGRVALVTGAGGGLGREYALLLAARGAKVVVNDLGGDMHGGGRSPAADAVVSTIRNSGGTAVANYDSVEDGDKVVKTAIENFGRIDILINNAGILRDRSLIKMTDKDWDLVYRVHLKGSFAVTRAAFPHMKKQGFGRIVMTSSPSGLYGNFGQTNYSSMKNAVVGFSNSVSKEGAKYNILCNTIAPQAWSRMTKHLYPPEIEGLMKVSDVAPLVGYLCHDSCVDNGTVLETAGGWTAKIQLQQGEGVVLKRPFTVEDVRDHWDKICDMSHPHYPTSATDTTMRIMPGLKEAAGQGSKDTDSTEVGTTTETVSTTITNRDVILYALGVGCGVTRTDLSDLKYLYEGHPDFSVLPSFAVIPAMNAVMGKVISGNVSGLKEFNLAQALHGEQYVELKRPFPTEGTVHSVGKVVDVADKKSGALIVVNAETRTESGELVAINQFSIFIIGAGGFGGKREAPNLKPTLPVPNRSPDASRQHKTVPSQAALYRLSGDLNPLHIDPDFAQLGGFKEPILHGLCSYGIATRHVLREYAGDDVSCVKAIKARFSKPVLPGHTIQTDMWKEGSRVHFECKVVETGDKCLSGGYIDLNINDKVPASSGPSNELKSTAVFKMLGSQVNADVVKKVGAIFQWNITKSGKVVAKWTTDLKNAPGAVYAGPPEGESPGCTLTISDEDFQAMLSGSLNAQKAFFDGRLKMAGNIMLSQKLSALFPPSNQAKL